MPTTTDHSRKIWRASACFVIASFLDYLMTCSLLSQPINAREVEFVESNPIAGYFLAVGGTAGLAGFKLAMVAMIAVVCRLIACRRAVTARRVLEFAALAGSTVVIYSVGLLIQHR